MTKLIKLLFVFALLILGFSSKSAFANDCVVDVGGGNWTSASTWTGCGGVAPTAADNAFATSTSGNLTIDSGAVARSFDTNGYTATTTHNTNVTLTLGDGTVGANNIALRLVSGMTYTLNNATNSAISFISTATTATSTVAFGGKTMANLTFNGVAGRWAMTSNLTTATSSTVTLTNGTIHLDGLTNNSGLTHSWGIFTLGVANTRVVYLGNSTLNLAANNQSVLIITNAGNLTWSIGTSQINIIGTGGTVDMATNSGTTPGLYGLAWTGAGAVGSMAWGAATLNIVNLSVTGSANANNIFLNQGSRTVKVTGTFTFAGNSATNRLLYQLTNYHLAGTASNVVVDLTGATVSVSHCDFQRISFISTTNLDWSALATPIGDAGGNLISGGGTLTFSPSVTQTWSGTSGGNWSANAWTTRMPLPQDDVVIASAFSASQTITVDVPRIGRSINWTGSTGTPAWAKTNTGGTNITMFGSLTMIAGMTNSGTQSFMWAGVSSYTWTSAGLTWTNPFFIRGIGGTLTFNDAFLSSSTVRHSLGVLSTNFNMTMTSFQASEAVAGNNVTMGSGTWTVTTTGTVWNVTVVTQTITSQTSTIVISNTSATAKTFTGGGASGTNAYYNITFSGDNITVTGSNTFGGTFAVNNGGLSNGLKLTINTTQTVSSFTTNGSSGSLAKLLSTSSGIPGVLSKTSGTVSVNFMSITDNIARGGAAWYAGTNSTNGGGNGGWIFSTSPGDKPATVPNEAVRGGANVRGGVKFR